MRVIFTASQTNYWDHLLPILGAFRDPVESVSNVRIAQDIHDPDALFVVAGARDAMDLAPRPCVLVEHGAGQRYIGRAAATNPSYSGGEGRGNVALFLCPNQDVADANLRTYPTAKAEVVGSPRLEHLTTIEREPEAVAFSWHWPCGLAVPEAGTAWKEYREAVAAFAAASPYPVIGHGHPKAWTYLEPWYREVGIEPVERFEEVVRRAKVYVCDNSSTLFESSALNIPVVLMNASTWRTNVPHGLRFWHYSGIGPNVWEPDRLADAIDWTLADPQGYREQRAIASRAIYGKVEGSAERAARAIAAFAGLTAVGA